MKHFQSSDDAFEYVSKNPKKCLEVIDFSQEDISVWKDIKPDSVKLTEQKTYYGNNQNISFNLITGWKILLIAIFHSIIMIDVWVMAVPLIMIPGAGNLTLGIIHYLALALLFLSLTLRGLKRGVLVFICIIVLLFVALAAGARNPEIVMVSGIPFWIMFFHLLYLSLLEFTNYVLYGSKNYVLHNKAKKFTCRKIPNEISQLSDSVEERLIYTYLRDGKIEYDPVFHFLEGKIIKDLEQQRVDYVHAQDVIKYLEERADIVMGILKEVVKRR